MWGLANVNFFLQKKKSLPNIAENVRETVNLVYSIRDFFVLSVPTSGERGHQFSKLNCHQSS